jgi:cystathionine gamma-lyase
VKFGTKAIHAGVHADESTGAIMTPIYQTSTYVQSAPGEHKGFEYSRAQNPTRKQLEDSLAALENGRFGMVFGSGLAAVDCILKTLKPGDHVIATSDLYGGSYRLFMQVFANYGIDFSYMDLTDASNLEPAIKENTKLVWIESPTNPMLNIMDVHAIAKITKNKGLLLGVDNTFATPYLQNPLNLGADVVMHSITKYIAGHSDVVMGGLVTSNENLAKQLYFIQNASGAIPGPQDCFLALRGIKTIHLRMERHCENAMKMASFLHNHPKVDQVHYPGLASHPNHHIAKKQMKDFGGMISFTTKKGTLESARSLVSKVKVITLAESLGGVESLIGHPVSMTHASIPKEERDKSGVVDSLIRLSVGIEDIDDLIKDIDQALA